MDKNSVWHYFNRTPEKDTPTCKQCSKKIKAAGGSTSGLHNHLKSQHNINLLKRKQEKAKDSPTSIGSRTKITSYFKKTIDDTFPAVVARMTARDGIPFIKFCTSQDLRMLLIAKGYTDIPKSSNSIREIVLEYADKVKQEIVNEITQEIIDNKAFSLTLDEWTSINNHRYMNINVHRSDNKFWNLGLCRIHGSMPAERCVILVENKLKEFGISLANIVSITTDGASVMKKVVKLTNVNHQLCLAHGIQLAVIKVLYGKNSFNNTEDAHKKSVKLQNTSDNDNSDDESDEEDEDDGEGLQLVQDKITNSHLNSFQNEQINFLIIKVRKVCKIFRRSPTKNDDILQKHVKEVFGKEISLILDSKTRWNSLLAMLERFFLIIDCVRKGLIDLKSGISFTDDELTLLSNVISALQPIKVAVETLCCEDVNLYIADVTLKFMLNELTNQNTRLSNELINALVCRIQERRNYYSDVLQYLSDFDLKSSKNEDFGIFNKTSKAAITKMIVELLERLYNRTEIDNSELSDEISDSDNNSKTTAIPSTTTGTTATTATNTTTIKEKLKFLIKMKTEVPNNKSITKKTTHSLSQAVSKELTYYQEEKIRGKHIQIVYDFLMTIRPTSVESERAFSVAGSLCTKIRSRLSDRSLDKLCFLRAYFSRKLDK